MNYTYKYPRMQVTTDVAVVCQTPRGNHVLLIKRKNEPFKNHWCFPGGFTEMGELLEESARRELLEETGFKADSLEFVRMFDAIGRDPRDRTITALFRHHISAKKLPVVEGLDDAADAAWWHLHDLLDMPKEFFGFDHKHMLNVLYNKYYFEY